MTSRSVVILRAAIVSCILLEFIQSYALAQALALPKNVEEALRANAAGLSPLTVYWTQTYQTTRQADEVVKIVKRDKRVFFSPEKRRESWQDGMIYSWDEYVSPAKQGEYGAFHQEHAVNGILFTQGDPDTSINGKRWNPHLIKAQLDKSAKDNPDARYFSHEYFLASGFHLPASLSEVRATDVTSLVLYFLRSKDPSDPCTIDQVKLEGWHLTRVSFLTDNWVQREAQNVDLVEYEKDMRKGPNSDEHIKLQLDAVQQLRSLPKKRALTFYLDPELNFAVRQREEGYEDGKTLVRCKCSSFKELSGRGVWLPQHCETSFFDYTELPKDFSPEPLLEQVIDVEKIETNSLPATQFVLDYHAPGTMVSDSTLPEADQSPDHAVSYTIPPSSQDLDSVIEEARERIRNPENSIPQGISPLRATLILINVAIVVFIGIVLARRQFRQ
jgi:hypothetical protein